ncbi:hypothetical protein QCA50_020314 [Cerrena zonata]|uniref:Uncharacterized protein n=1 Tax=Cerrena zonata TaxID=2478898 RepID=A0AAW0F9A7_9APHY
MPDGVWITEDRFVFLLVVHLHTFQIFCHSHLHTSKDLGHPPTPSDHATSNCSPCILYTLANLNARFLALRQYLLSLPRITHYDISAHALASSGLNIQCLNALLPVTINYGIDLRAPINIPLTSSPLSSPCPLCDLLKTLRGHHP